MVRVPLPSSAKRSNRRMLWHERFRRARKNGKNPILGVHPDSNILAQNDRTTGQEAPNNPSRRKGFQSSCLFTKMVNSALVTFERVGVLCGSFQTIFGVCALCGGSGGGRGQTDGTHTPKTRFAKIPHNTPTLEPCVGTSYPLLSPFPQIALWKTKTIQVFLFFF